MGRARGSTLAVDLDQGSPVQQEKTRTYCWHFKFKAWEGLGVCDSGSFLGAEEFPSRDHDLAAAQAWRRQRSPSARFPGARPGRGIGVQICVGADEGRRCGGKDTKFKATHGSPPRAARTAQRPPPPGRGAPPEPALALPPRLPARSALQCKFQRDKLLINSLEEKRVSFFLLFFICFYFCMAPSYALGSLAAQQFSLHFNILKKMQISTVWPF